MAEQSTELAAAVGSAGEGVHHLVVVPNDHRVVAEVDADDNGQGGKDDDVDGAVDGDEAQHIAIPQQGSAQRELDLVAAGDETPGRLGRGRHREPGVAAQAATPPGAVELPDDEGVVGADLGGVSADEHVAAHGAAQLLVAVVSAEPHVRATIPSSPRPAWSARWPGWAGAGRPCPAR